MATAKNAGRSESSRRATLRGGRNIVSRNRLRTELWPASDAHVDFQYFDLTRQSSDASSPLHWQGMRKALVAGLRDHVQFVSRNMERLREPSPGIALPYGMALALMNALQEVNDGESAALFVPKRLPGGRGNRRSLAKQTSIDWAVRYLTATQLGWALRPSARSKVVELYGVTSRQVQRWIATAGTLRRREVQLREWANAVGFRASTEEKAVRALEKLLPAMARRYRGE